MTCVTQSLHCFERRLAIQVAQFTGGTIVNTPRQRSQQ